MTQESTTGAGRMGEKPLPVFIEGADIVRLLRMRCDESGGQGAYAAAAGLSETLISLVLSGKQKPGPKVARALGFRKKFVFVPLQQTKQGA